MTTDKVALVTGANKGIGKEIARQLGTLGYVVLVGARDAGRGETAAAELRAAGGDARFVPLDLDDAESLANAVRGVEADFGKLDVLVNNAGIALAGDRVPPSQTSLDTLRQTYETNVFAPIAVMQAFLPLLRKSPAARIVNMSSGLGSLTQHSDPAWEFYAVKPLAYDTSKTALNAVTVHFAYELRDTPIKVNAADPGYVATDLNNNSGPRTVAQGAKIAVDLATLPADGPTGGYFNDEGPLPW